MSGWHAHAPSAESGGSKIQLADNLLSVWKDTLKTGKNALVNGSNAVYSLWENVVGRVGDILVKKPVSAALHLAGWPVAKILDGTFSGVARVLTLGKIKKLQPLAKTFKTTDSLIASVVDSVAHIKPQWTSREWNGTRGYLKRVHGKITNWKKTTEEAHKAKKAAKKEAKAHKTEHPAKDDHHAKKWKKEEHHTETAWHAKDDHHPAAKEETAKHDDHGHDAPADAHKKEEHTEDHSTEKHHDTHTDDHGTKEEHHEEKQKDDHAHAAPADAHKKEEHGHADPHKKDDHAHAAPAH